MQVSVSLVIDEALSSFTCNRLVVPLQYSSLQKFLQRDWYRLSNVNIGIVLKAVTDDSYESVIV
eukprot:scaffold45119_cov49-Attheya_sp.AAC.4